MFVRYPKYIRVTDFHSFFPSWHKKLSRGLNMCNTIHTVYSKEVTAQGHYTSCLKSSFRPCIDKNNQPS
jgi:hypothetical protein